MKCVKRVKGKKGKPDRIELLVTIDLVAAGVVEKAGAGGEEVVGVGAGAAAGMVYSGGSQPEHRTSGRVQGGLHAV